MRKVNNDWNDLHKSLKVRGDGFKTNLPAALKRALQDIITARQSYLCTAAYT